MAIISNATTIADAGSFSVGLGSMVLIKTLTASSSSTLNFVDGSASVVLDSTYPIYKFEFINIHAATDQADFTFQVNAAGASGFNETITSTHFGGYHRAGDNASSLGYQSGGHQANGTAYQRLFADSNNGNTDSSSGYLYIFDPSSTTFVTQFVARMAGRGSDTSDPSATYYHTGGYVNATAAVDEVSFKMSSGNIDAGTIKLYGIKIVNMAVISNGTTLLDAGALSVASGSMTLIKTVTVSSDTANISFIHGSSDVVFDSTYKEYVFKYINIHPAANAKTLRFNLSVDGLSSTAVKTTTFFRAFHSEDDSDTTFSYDTGEDIQSADGDQTLGELIGADNDQSASGFLHLYDPASTTFVKHFMAETSYSQQSDYAFRGMMSGYANVTAAINSIIFKFVGANIGSGTIKMYGIK